MQKYNSKIKIIKLLFCVFIFNFSFLIFNLNVVNAQSLPIQVAPTRQEININPGEQSGITVKFFNLSDFPVTGIIRTADFIVEGNEGRPRILDDINEAPPEYAASNWIELPYENITIAANNKVTVQAKINAPPNANPGGKYVALYFEPNGQTPVAIGVRQQAGTAVSTRLASLIYIKVAGPINESASVSRLFAPGFLEFGPVKIDSEILNRGNYHIRPNGVVIMTNMFGNVISQEKLKEQNIFPNTSRTYLNNLGQKWMLGKYKISLQGSYGQNGGALNRALYIWVFPWRVAVVTLLALIILIYISRSAYNRIIKKEAVLEQEIEEEKAEIEKLREALKKRKD